MKKATRTLVRRMQFTYARPGTSKRWHMVTPWNRHRTFCDQSFTADEVTGARVADDIPAGGQGCLKCAKAAAELGGNLQNHAYNTRGPRLFQ